MWSGATRSDGVSATPAAAPPRRLLGLLVGTGLVVLAAVVLVPLRGHLSRTSPALVLVLPVVVAAIAGGRVPAVLTGVVAAGIYSFVFIPPYDSYKIAVSDDAVALGVFVVVALVVGTLVALEAERRRAAEDRTAEIRQLYRRYELVVAERERLMAESNRLAIIQRVDEQRSALLRSVSHDLRTPLATIQAVATDLRAGAAFDDATRDELLELVADEAQRLNRIVENLLSLSRIEAGALHPDRQAIALDELVTDRAGRLSRLFDGVGVVTAIEPGLPFVDADYVQLDLVLTNLLENAARFAPAGTTVRVEARALGEQVEVVVADQGPGIAPDARASLFEPFEKGRASTGTGIGLAICRSVVEAHGGSIRVEDQEPCGARFVFTVPVRSG